MASTHLTTEAILEEFARDPDALAAEVLALRRVVAELRSVLDALRDPIVVISSPDRTPPPPPPVEPWPPIVPRVETAR